VGRLGLTDMRPEAETIAAKSTEGLQTDCWPSLFKRITLTGIFRCVDDDLSTLIKAMEGKMLSFAKPSGVASRVLGHRLRSPSRRARVNDFAGLAASFDALGQLGAAVTAAARGRLRIWRHRLASRSELKLYAE
jgi:hypothetical protein